MYQQDSKSTRMVVWKWYLTRQDLIGSNLQLRKEMVWDHKTKLYRTTNGTAVYRTSAGQRLITHCSSSARGGCWQKKLVEARVKEERKK